MSAQDKFFNGLNQAVMVIVQRRDKIGGLFYIRIRVCHCHACARSQKHGNIVGGITGGNAVFFRNAEYTAYLQDSIPLSGLVAVKFKILVIGKLRGDLPGGSNNL